MANTSATGGYLVPYESGQTDLELSRLIGDLLAGLTGFDRKIVRPEWQINPASMPDIDATWIAYGRAFTDASAIIDTKVSPDGTYIETSRKEDITFAVRVYGPESDFVMGVIRDGIQITQNRAQIRKSGCDIRTTGQINHNPELINDRWWSRSDMTLIVSRDVKRKYKVLDMITVNTEFRR